MRFFKKLFKKESEKQQDIYAYMGSLGVSPEHMMMYQESVRKIKEYEERMKTK